MSAPIDPVHVVTQDDPWSENVGDHVARTDSAEYTRSHDVMIAIIKTIPSWPFGPPPYQDHHAGSIPLHDSNGWFFILDLVGSEWSAQFCLDPVKIDAWRQRVARIVAGFPDTVAQLEALGYPDAKTLLDTPVVDAVGIALWVDGVFNASLPLPQGFHTGFLTGGKQQAGYHNYPKPVADVQHLKRADFTLWVTDAQGKPAAVAPVAAHGSGNGAVRVLYATPDSDLHAQLQASVAQGQALVFPAEHPLAKLAFSAQENDVHTTTTAEPTQLT